jgi:hypothetical protein
MRTRLIVVGAVLGFVLLGVLAFPQVGSAPTQLTSSRPAPQLSNCGSPIADPAPPPSRHRRTPSGSIPARSPYYHQIQQALSTDGLHWRGEPRILFEHASVPDITQLKDGRLLMLAVEFTDHIENLGVSFSSDLGATWSPFQEATIWGWNDRLGMPVDPDISQLGANCYRMTFLALSGGPNGGEQRVYSAVSADAITYVLEEGVRAAANQIYDPDVIRFGDTWLMFIGQMIGDEHKTLLATSQDGLNYSLQSAPVAQGSIPGAIVLPGGKIRLYTVSRDGVRIYGSDDGLSYALEGRLTGVPGLDPSTVRLPNGSYLMIHKTFMKR